MAYYNICRKCGANLDPGERCDCEEAAKKRADFFGIWTRVERTRQIAFDFGNLSEPCIMKN